MMENSSQHKNTSFATFKSNETSSNRRILYTNSAWVVCEIILLACIIVALYLLYALLHHRAIKAGRHSDKAIVTRQRKGGELLENLCIVGVLIALLRFTNNQVLVFIGWDSTDTCSGLLNVTIALYFIAIHPIYFFLWVRQRIFYSNRALKHLYSKTIRFFSWMALVSVVVTTALSMILFTVDRQSSASGRVCEDPRLPNASSYDKEGIATETSPQGVKANITAGILAGGIQLSFLALFLYPIMDNKLRVMRTRHMRNGSTAVITLIRRSFVLASLCILSDVAIALLVKTITAEFPDAKFAPLAMYDINLIINLLCIIMTFRRWRVMLFPWFYATSCCSTLQCVKHSLIQRKSFRKYRVSFAGKQIPCEITSTEVGIHEEIHNQSKIYHERKKSRRQAKLRRPPSPIPDVILPMFESHAQNSPTAKECKSDIGIAENNYLIDIERHQHSDTALYIPYRKCESKRSASLVLINDASPQSIKTAKPYIAISILAKPKRWLSEFKVF